MLLKLRQVVGRPHAPWLRRARPRAPHENFHTTQLYVREAEAIRDGFSEVATPRHGKLSMLNPKRLAGHSGDHATWSHHSPGGISGGLN